MTKHLNHNNIEIKKVGSLYHLPGWPFFSDISKHDQVEHFVQVDDHPEDIAECEHDHDSGQYDGNALISPLSGGCLLVHAACSLDSLVQHSVED